MYLENQSEVLHFRLFFVLLQRKDNFYEKEIFNYSRGDNAYGVRRANKERDVGCRQYTGI